MAVPLVVFTATACQPRPEPQMFIVNPSDQRFVVYVERPGDERAEVGEWSAGMRYHYTSGPILANGCEDAVLVAVRNDGKTFRTGPPLCKDETWTLGQ